MTINKQRGEAAIVIAGKTYVVGLTLDATARLGSLLGVERMQELTSVIFSPPIDKFSEVVQALLLGNGYDVPLGDIRGRHGVRVNQYLAMLKDLFEVSDKVVAGSKDAGASDKGNVMAPAAENQSATPSKAPLHS